jgi:hypothetical protein
MNEHESQWERRADRLGITLWAAARDTGCASSSSMPGAKSRARRCLTGGTTCKAIMGNWSYLLFGVRKDINVQVLNQTLMGSNLQLAILAYVRCDFAATRAASFVTE